MSEKKEKRVVRKQLSLKQSTVDLAIKFIDDNKIKSFNHLVENLIESNCDQRKGKDGK